MLERQEERKVEVEAAFVFFLTCLTSCLCPSREALISLSRMVNLIKRARINSGWVGFGLNIADQNAAAVIQMKHTVNQM